MSKLRSIFTGHKVREPVFIREIPDIKKPIPVKEPEKILKDSFLNRTFRKKALEKSLEQQQSYNVYLTELKKYQEIEKTKSLTDKYVSDAQVFLKHSTNKNFDFYVVRVFNEDSIKESPKLKAMLEDAPDSEIPNFNLYGIRDTDDLSKFIDDNPDTYYKILDKNGEIVDTDSILDFYNEV